MLMKVIRLVHVILGYTFNRFQYTPNILGTQGLCAFVKVSAPKNQKRNAPQTGRNQMNTPSPTRVQYPLARQNFKTGNW